MEENYNFYLKEQVWGEIDIIWTIIFIIIVLFYVYLAYNIWTNQIITY
jgi:heme/copper-type cytochrome/quinol oxidase subunit 2